MGDGRFSAARRSALVYLGGDIRFLGGFAAGIGDVCGKTGADFRESSLLELERLNTAFGDGFIFEC
jgi:hypothetical protein